MIRKLLKRIFPTAFLKQCFLIYNKVKIRTVDTILYSPVDIPRNEFAIWREDFPFRINQVDLSPLQGRPEFSYMKEWMNWKELEYLLELRRKCFIEPEHGWAIVPPNKLIFESLAYSRTSHQKKPDLMAFFARRDVQKVDFAISLRDPGEENYFHFYNDVLGKVFFLREQGVDISRYKFIVSVKLWEKPYFRFYRDNVALLRALQWVIQDKQYVECSTVIFCKPMTHSISLWNAFTLATNRPANLERRIFLTRSKDRLRFIENEDEVRAVCDRQGIEIVDADNFTFIEQVRLFSAASFIAGIHGAGLANMIYRSGPCSVLEIFPPPDPGYLPYHYILLAKMKGFRYHALIGGKGRSYSGGFHLDVHEFEKELRALL